MASTTALFGRNAQVLQRRDYQLLLLANMGPPLGTALVSPLLESLTGPFGVSATEIGLMMTMYTAPTIVLIPVVGALADRYGRKPLLILGLVLFGAAGVGMAATTNFAAILALRFLQGIGFSALTPIIITSIGDLYAGAEEETAQGLRFGSSGAAQTLFPLLAGALVSVAWQYPFYIYAITLPIALLVYLFFDEPGNIQTDDPKPHRSSNGGPPAEDATPSYARGEWIAYGRDLRAVGTHPRVVALLIARAIPPFIFTGFLTYNSFLVVQLLGETPKQAGMLVAALSLVYAITATQAGRITDAFESRMGPLVVANLSLGGGFVVVGLARGILTAAAGAAIIGVGFGITLSLYRSIITALATEDLRGSLVGLGESSGRFAATLSPIVMNAIIGWLAATYGFGGGVRITFVGIGVVGGAAGIACLVMAQRAPEVASASTAPK